MFTLRNISTGSQVPAESDQYKQLISLSQGGALQTAATAGRLFSIANQGAVATTAALATTWTGLGVSNPATSGKNLIIHEFGWALTVVGPAAGAVGLMTSDTTGFAAALTIRNCKDGITTASIAYADDGATIATPVLGRVYGTFATGAVTTAMLYAPTVVDLKGSLVIPPGRSVMTYTTTATTASLIFHLLWEEVPV